MGTPASIRVYDQYDDCIVAMNCRFDGHFYGVGFDLAKFLSGITMVNGIPADDKNVANGMGDLAGLLVCHFKQGKPGDFYLYPDEGEGDSFDYTVTIVDDELVMTASHNDYYFRGPPSEYEVFLGALTKGPP